MPKQISQGKAQKLNENITAFSKERALQEDLLVTIPNAVFQGKPSTSLFVAYYIELY